MSRRPSRSPKIRDVANYASVSIGTVSRVLNEHRDVASDLRRRVQLAIDELGYRPNGRASRRKNERPGVISLVMCNGSGFNAVHAYLLLGIEEACAQANCYLMFARHQYEPHVRSTELLLPGITKSRDLADCLIITGTNYDNFLKALDNAGVCYVTLVNHVVGRQTKRPGKNQVRYNDYEGFGEATRYLIQLGHKNIWYIGDTSKPWFQQRYEGYEKTMLENSLDPLAQRVGLADNQVENGRAAVSLILDQKRPISAILAGSDEIALGAKEGLVQHGLTVPRDVSVIGFQHQIETFSATPLTSVCVDTVEVGRQLAKAAIKRIESGGRDVPESTVATVLVKRGSCRPLRTEEHMVL